MRRACRLVLSTTIALATLSGVGARSAEPVWWDYQIIMWQDHTAVQNAALKALGVTAGMVIADRSGRDPGAVAAQIAPLRDGGLPWFVENIATDFYSPYHR